MSEGASDPLGEGVHRLRGGEGKEEDGPLRCAISVKLSSYGIRTFDFVNIDQLTLAPETDLRDFVIDGVNTQIDLFSWISMDFEL